MAFIKLKIASGECCWRYDGKGDSCYYFDNEGGHGNCEVFHSSVRRGDYGYTKCEECIEATIKETK